MKRYLQSILLFDIALPALFLGLPCVRSALGGVGVPEFCHAEKAEEHAAYETAEPAGDGTQRGTATDASEGLSPESTIVQ